MLDLFPIVVEGTFDMKIWAIVEVVAFHALVTGLVERNHHLLLKTNKRFVVDFHVTIFCLNVCLARTMTILASTANYVAGCLQTGPARIVGVVVLWIPTRGRGS